MFPEEELNENISSERKEYDLTNLFERLAKSDFRSRFHLSMKDWEYIMEKGLPTIRKHAEDFVAKRLAPAVIPNDGKPDTERPSLISLAVTATFIWKVANPLYIDVRLVAHGQIHQPEKVNQGTCPL